MKRADLYRLAAARAQAQRAILIDSAHAAKARIAPARIKTDIKEKLVTSIGDAGRNIRATARQRPVATTAVLVGLGAWFARGPLAALFRRLFVRFRNPDTVPSNLETDNG